MSENARHIYTCPGVSKTLFEHYSYNSVILPLPTRCNSHLRLKALDGQFLQLRAHDLLYSKAKYKISGKLQWDQPLVVSVVLSFVQLHSLLRLCLVSIRNVFGTHRDAYFTVHPPKDFACHPFLSRCIGKQALPRT